MSVAASTFDTLSAVDKLRSANLGEMQARAIVDSIRDAQTVGTEHLATKADIARLEGKISGLEGRIIGPEGKISGLEGRIIGLEGRINVLQWVVGIQSAVILAVAFRVFGLV